LEIERDGVKGLETLKTYIEFGIPRISSSNYARQRHWLAQFLSARVYMYSGILGYPYYTDPAATDYVV